MKKSTLFFLCAALIVALGGVLFFLQSPKETPPPPLTTQPMEKAPSVEAQPTTVVRLPLTPPPAEVVETTPKKVLPTLEKSDTHLRQSLTALLPQKNWLDLFIFDQLIRRFVLMIDSLPRPDISYSRLPLYTPYDRFIPSEDKGVLTISPENYPRYAPFVQMVEKVELGAAAEIYFRYYPLFQEAYTELGYPDRQFNERFIEVVDHLLATPVVKDPIYLVQPHIRYQYADPKLEALSTGQKLLVRMGSRNAATVLARLLEFKPLLVNFTPGDN